MIVSGMLSRIGRGDKHPSSFLLMDLTTYPGTGPGKVPYLLGVVSATFLDSVFLDRNFPVIASTFTSMTFAKLGAAISNDQISLPRAFSNSELLITP